MGTNKNTSSNSYNQSSSHTEKNQPNSNHSQNYMNEKEFGLKNAQDYFNKDKKNPSLNPNDKQSDKNLSQDEKRKQDYLKTHK